MHLSWKLLAFVAILISQFTLHDRALAETPLAYSLEPMQAEFILPNLSQSFTLRNLTEVPRNLRIEVLDRRQDGEREINRKTSELRVLESRIQLPPESSKTFLVEYRGPKELKLERAYRLIVTDETLGTSTKDSLRLSYRASIFVREQAHAPDLFVRSWKSTGGARFEVVLKNRGKVRQALAGLGFQGLELVKDSVRSLEAGVLLAGAERKLNLEVTDPHQIEAAKTASGLVLRFPGEN